MKQPSITVQYAPFVLTLEITREGGITASLRRTTDPAAAPAMVYAASDNGRAAAGTEQGGPVLWIGTTAFSLPKRQLTRVADWLDGQRTPVETASGQDGAAA